MDDFLLATLGQVRRCPARADYLELRFSTDEGEWDWCFPEPPAARRRPLRPLALRLGTYGVQAHLVRDGTLGTAVPTAAAVPTILAGAPVYVDRRLLRSRV
ncbi:hypothetical protein [Cryptosporangium aurantiacum]|uniref:Uncharacterized protein n=1 Tax=Cryptosporangium aurantiacum TaxID=134849 RepID=A0A1M7KIG7_9ACTN|nr:hypothetical protein [Cryptosporangium aurantiacum]SHM65136.1 hypothetical protein SAMN05443668_1011145 [Cryptosporangium aurantiacum]